MANKVSEPKACVLLIDDELDICEIVKITLEQIGYEVLIAPDGERGLQLFREYRVKIKLVLLDMAMAKTSGLDALEQIKKLDSKVPIIIMSGYISSKAEAVNLGAQGALKKPFRLSELEEVVANALKG